MLSVVLCTYNGEKYIREQLDSILNQTLPPDEIIIQDDASNDNTWFILKQYETLHPQIKLFRNQHPIGCDLNFLSAIKKSTGDLIAISDQDDVWLPTKLNQLAFVLSNNPDCLFCYCSSLYFENDNIPEAPFPKCKQSEIDINACILISGCTGHSTLIRKEFFEFINQYVNPDRIVQLCNWWYYDRIFHTIALSMNQRVIHFPEYLTLHRRLSTSLTKSAISKTKGLTANLRMISISLRRISNPMIRKNFINSFQIMGQILENLPVQNSSAKEGILLCNLLSGHGLINEIMLFRILIKNKAIWGKGIKGTIRAMLHRLIIFFCQDKKIEHFNIGEISN